MSAPLRRTALAEELWLFYYNQRLFERGVITELQRNKMQLIIASRRRGPPRSEGAGAGV